MLVSGVVLCFLEGRCYRSAVRCRSELSVTLEKNLFLFLHNSAHLRCQECLLSRNRNISYGCRFISLAWPNVYVSFKQIFSCLQSFHLSFGLRCNTLVNAKWKPNVPWRNAYRPTPATFDAIYLVLNEFKLRNKVEDVLVKPQSLERSFKLRQISRDKLSLWLCIVNDAKLLPCHSCRWFYTKGRLFIL